MQIFYFLFICLFIFSSDAVLQAKDTAEQGISTNIFPEEVKISEGANSFILKKTGSATRKKFIVKVYHVAGYIQKDALGKNGQEVVQNYLDDKYAKELIMHFVHDVGSEQLKKTYMEGFSKVIPAASFPKYDQNIHYFLNFFKDDIKSGDQMVIRVFPHGNVEVLLNDKQIGNIKDESFAKALLTIWFGPESSMREDLVSSIR